MSLSDPQTDASSTSRYSPASQGSPMGAAGSRSMRGRTSSAAMPSLLCASADSIAAQVIDRDPRQAQLPQAQLSQAQLPQAQPSPPQLSHPQQFWSGHGTARDVLVVDDLPESLDLLSRILSNQGLNVRVAPTGKLALQSIRLTPPALILLDVSLSDMGGFEICQQLNADPVTQHIPIIFLSAHDNVQAKAKAFQMGAVDFIAKPFEAVELLARVKNHLRLQDLWHRLHKRNEHQQKLLNEHRTLKQLLFQEKELAEVTLQSIGDAVVTTNALGQIQSLNPVAEKLLRCSRLEAKGRDIREVFRLHNELTGVAIVHPVLEALEAGVVISPDGQSILVNGEGEEFPVSESVAPIRDRIGNVIGAIMVFRDVTESRQMARRLSWQATHDPLTHLFNRSEFERQLLLVLDQVRLKDQLATLCYVDLDRFKIVNDTCGHVAGDELLRQVTLAVQQKISAQDIFARVGGDEFALILLNRSPEEAEALAEKICRAVQDFRFAWQSHTFKIGASIGLVHLDADYRDTSDVLNSADAACYFSKERGRNQVQVYRGDNQAIAQRRDESQWINRLNLALQDARFCLYGQAIVSLAPRPMARACPSATTKCCCG
ncbi:MAG: diguanylate cyclase [Synechococcales cyanobacterium CRU_2_2]|nr:diguanylate cyclase [Synechococcales cyanobacterium CRU_2_2]